MPQVSISDDNFARLQGLAVPLVDTVDTVLTRALDALEGTSGGTADVAGQVKRLFWSASPPDLSFTSVRAASVDDQLLPPAETYWNSILIAVIRAASAHGALMNQIKNKLLANHIAGNKDDGGYKPIPGMELSVQGQDANNAWKSIAYMADAFGIKVDVEFAWQNNPKATLPGQTGRLAVGSARAR